MRTLADAASIDYFHRHYQESLEKCLKAIELSHGANDPRAEFAAHYGAVLVLRFLGDSQAAGRHAAALLGPAERLRDRTLLSNAFLANELVSSLKGDWQTARDFSDRGLGIAPRDPRHLGYRVVLEYQVGNFAQGEAYLKRLLEVMRRAPPEPSNEYAMPAEIISLVARITGQMGLLDIARSAAQTVLSSPHKTPIMADDARAGLAMTAVQLGDSATALEQYAALEPLRGTILPGGSVCSDRVLGLLAQTAGQLDRAVEHFEAALVFCRKGGYRPELAWTYYDYAILLGQRDDRKRASALLSEALALSTALGMHPLIDRVNFCRERIGAPPPKRQEYVSALTERQVQVLRLVARGKTNREIAEELVLSERTVQRHITNIYTKIAARNRAEATAFTLSQLAPSQ
jgi:DNA-binding CsgD family transcriptional regulator/tetratricopeptide (TPR) repeat protein